MREDRRTDVNALSLRETATQPGESRLHCAMVREADVHLDEGDREGEVGEIVENERAREKGANGHDLSPLARRVSAELFTLVGPTRQAHVLEPPVPAHLHVLHIVEHRGEPSQEARADGRVDQVPER